MSDDRTDRAARAERAAAVLTVFADLCHEPGADIRSFVFTELLPALAAALRAEPVRESESERIAAIGRALESRGLRRSESVLADVLHWLTFEGSGDGPWTPAENERLRGHLTEIDDALHAAGASRFRGFDRRVVLSQVERIQWLADRKAEPAAPDPAMAARAEKDAATDSLAEIARKLYETLPTDYSDAYRFHVIERLLRERPVITKHERKPLVIDEPSASDRYVPRSAEAASKPTADTYIASDTPEPGTHDVVADLQHAPADAGWDEDVRQLRVVVDAVAPIKDARPALDRLIADRDRLRTLVERQKAMIEDMDRQHVERDGTT